MNATISLPKQIHSIQSIPSFTESRIYFVSYIVKNNSKMSFLEQLVGEDRVTKRQRTEKTRKSRDTKKNIKSIENLIKEKERFMTHGKKACEALLLCQRTIEEIFEDIDDHGWHPVNTWKLPTYACMKKIKEMDIPCTVERKIKTHARDADTRAFFVDQGFSIVTYEVHFECSTCQATDQHDFCSSDEDVSDTCTCSPTINMWEISWD